MLTVTVHSAYKEIAPEAWDAVVGDSSPFLEWRWLNALEESECVAMSEGWLSRPIVVRRDGQIVAAAPAYVKSHSMGEFVYDWAWAHAARQMGEAYYPKLIVGVPFSPVTGHRLLIAPGEDPAPLRELLVGALLELAKRHRCAGVHVLFDTAEEAAALEELGGLTRLQTQSHWTDTGYGDFDGFLAAFESKRRRALRRERRRLAEVPGLEVQVLLGEQIRPEHLLAMERFYLNTSARFGGFDYLKSGLWRWMGEGFRDRLVLVLALLEGEPVAGALDVRGGDRLYGRYWGADVEIPFLHFEVCYYKAIEWALQNGVRVFEPGHGGEHKKPRGFRPTLCYSNHWILTPKLARSVAEFLPRERAAVLAHLEEQEDESPLRG